MSLEAKILETAVITLKELLLHLDMERPGDSDGKEHVAGYVHAELVVIDRLEGIIKLLREVNRVDANKARGVMA